MIMAARTMVRVLARRSRIWVIWVAGFDYNLPEKMRRAAIFASLLYLPFSVSLLSPIIHTNIVSGLAYLWSLSVYLKIERFEEVVLF